MKPIIVNYADSEIILSSAFKKKAFTPGTSEYMKLMEVRHEFPGFDLVTREFRTNTTQDRHKGLTYDYMRRFIQKYDEENAEEALATFDKMLDIAQAHSKSKRYPVIKSWFLNRYPDYAEFGMTEEQVQEYRSNKRVVGLREGDNSAASEENAALSAEALKKAS